MPQRLDPLEERLWVVQDANYNVTALLNDRGAVVERYAYDPHGLASVLTPAFAARASSSYGWVHLHQGGRLEPTTGMYQFGHRWYSPTLMRWLQQDPIGFDAGDTNLYRYVGNNPTNATDPSGLDGGLALIPGSK